MLDCSQNISGPNKIVKIDETKFARRKCHWTHVVKGQWMFGGVKRESRKTFLVPVYDRTANTLLVVLRYQSNPALQSSATAGRRIGTWKRKATHIKPSTIQSFSFLCALGQIRTRSTAREDIPQSLKPDGGLYLTPGPIHACDWVPIRQNRPLHQLHRHRCKHRLQRENFPQSK